MALHYEICMQYFQRCPVTISVGGSNTGKTLTAKMAASMHGLHRRAIYGKVLNLLLLLVTVISIDINIYI